MYSINTPIHSLSFERAGSNVACFRANPCVAFCRVDGLNTKPGTDLFCETVSFLSSSSSGPICLSAGLWEGKKIIRDFYPHLQGQNDLNTIADYRMHMQYLFTYLRHLIQSRVGRNIKFTNHSNSAPPGRLQFTGGLYLVKPCLQWWSHSQNTWVFRE